MPPDPKGRRAEIVAALTFTISDVHDDTFYARLATRYAASPDVDRVYLKDPGGLLAPERAATLLPALRAALGDTPLELHSHTTIGLSPLSYLTAAEHGVAALQTGSGPLAGGTSLPDAQRLVANLRELGHDVDVDARHQPPADVPSEVVAPVEVDTRGRVESQEIRGEAQSGDAGSLPRRADIQDSPRR